MKFGTASHSGVLSYQWVAQELSDDRKVHYWKGWEPKDIQWLWADLQSGEVKPLADLMPEVAAHLGRLGQAGGLRFVPHNAPYRWRLENERFWAARSDHVGLSLSATPLLSMRFPLDAPLRSPQEGLREISPTTVLGREWGRGHGEVSGEEDRLRFGFDIMPLSADRVLLFIMVNSRMTEYEWTPPAAKERNVTRRAIGEWRECATYRSPVDGSFHVAATKDDYFFVTDSGAVYCAEKAGGQWTTQTVWQDAARPILAMLVQADGATAFVFGKDFYFKVAKEVQPTPCRDVTRGPQALGDPMRHGLRMWRACFMNRRN